MIHLLSVLFLTCLSLILGITSSYKASLAYYNKQKNYFYLLLIVWLCITAFIFFFCVTILPHLVEYEADKWLYVWLYVLLCAVSWTDAIERLIPTVLTLWQIPCMLLVPFFFSSEYTLISMSVGALAGYLVGVSIKKIGKKVYRRDAFGDGDIDILVLIGSVQGLMGLYYALFIGSCTALIFLAFVFLVGFYKKDDPIPFAPFLSLGSFAWTVYYLM